MRIHLMGATLALALAAPGAALAQSGHVDLSYATQNYDFGGPEFEVEAVGVGGQVAFGGAPLGVQLDGRYAIWGGDADDVDVWSVGAHVFKRHDAWLAGAYVGYDELEDFNADAWTAALETQFYLSRGTLSGVLSHSEWNGPGYAATMLEGEYRHFFNDNFSLHGGLGFGQGDIGTNDPDIWSGEVGAEYMFAGMPVSVFGFYRRSSMDFGPGEMDVDTLSAGVRYNWAGSLMNRDRNGASLRRVPSIFDRFLS